MTSEEIFAKRGDEGLEAIKENLAKNGLNATGKTKDSLRRESDAKSVTIFAREFFEAMETGSKPSVKNPSPEMVESIKEWAEMRGTDAKPYAIAKSILKKGSRLWRAGGRTDIFTNVADQMTKDIADDLVKSIKI